MTMMIMTERRDQRMINVKKEKMIQMMMMMEIEINQNQKVVDKEMNQKHQKKIIKYFFQ